jgi:hypothetical protein
MAPGNYTLYSCSFDFPKSMEFYVNVVFSLMQEYQGCQVFGQTLTTDHHQELIQLGISPSLNWTKSEHKFPYVIVCAPPYQSSDYHGDLR